jgi:hypothetical protein
MREFLKFVPCLMPFLFTACSVFFAGTTEESNALAGMMEEDVAGIPSSSGESSSSTLTQVVESSSGIYFEPVGAVSSSSEAWIVVPTSSPTDSLPLEPASSSGGFVKDSGDVAALQARYWYPYWNEGPDRSMVNMDVDTEEGDEVSVSFTVSMPLGGGSSPELAGFGVAIRVDGDDSTAFSEMKTWTSGVCFMMTSDAPITLKIGMSPEKEEELDYDLPQIELITAQSAGSLVINCKSWSEFKQRGTGAVAITGEEAFAQMTALKFEAHPTERTYKGTFEIYDIHAYGSGLNVNIDGMDVSINEGK